MSVGAMAMSGETNFQPIDKFFSNIDFVVPGYHRSSQYMVAIHRAFYEWASAKLGGGRILEAGCGEGFGAEILSRSADHVVAIDIKPELVKHARRRYPTSNLDFEVMDCSDLVFESKTFDVVVCNELLEHLEEYEAFLHEAERVLVDGGRFICSTTNADITFNRRDGRPLNRNHFQEFGPAEFQSLLLGIYPSTILYSQVTNVEYERFAFNNTARSIERLLMRLGIKHKIPIGLRNFIRERVTGASLEAATLGGFGIVEGSRPGALYLIGEATKDKSQ